jgi:putative ABC transport system permease protein
MKYVIYSGSAAVLGCVLGYLGGVKLFPWVIWEVYRMMYGFADVSFRNSVLMFVISFVFALICTVGVTVFTCVSELKGMPAELIRPKAPPPGKRILLERIGFIWSKMRFLHKVSVRNVFRFKRRMMMMIVGIAGCTALLITAFGLYDSICNVVGDQYDNILKFDIAVDFEDSASEADLRAAAADADAKYGADSVSGIIMVERAKNDGGGYIRDVSMFISDDESMNDIFGLRDYKTNELMPWPADGEVAVSSKMAEKNDLKVGDSIKILVGDDETPVYFKVGEIFTNYTYHYVMMTPETFAEATGKTYQPKELLVMFGEGVDISPYDYANYIAGNYSVTTWAASVDSRQSFSNTMERMNYIIVLVVSCAAALAFIVLFNLNNINITERIREIATLKVMGFYRNETGAYVTRENLLLVLMGYAAGIPLGFALHRFVMAQIEMDIVTYDVRITLPSFFYALGFVLLFSLIVDVIMRGKIEQIDMTESLKSIE